MKSAEMLQIYQTTFMFRERFQGSVTREREQEWISRMHAMKVQF